MHEVSQLDAYSRDAAVQVHHNLHMLGTRHDGYFRHAGALHPHQRVVNHRIPSDGKQVLVRDASEWEEPAAGTTGEDDAFQIHGCGREVSWLLEERGVPRAGERGVLDDSLAQ